MFDGIEVILNQFDPIVHSSAATGRLDRPPARPYCVPMRWDALFGDMESQLAAEAARDLEAEVGELVRAEMASATLADLFRGAVGEEASLMLRSGMRVQGRVAAAAEEWLLLATGPRSVLVPARAVAAMAGGGRRIASPAGAVKRTLASVLRELARNRAVAMVLLDSPGGDTLTGVLDAVGADFLVLARLADGPGRRHGNYAGHTTVALAAVLSISSEADPPA
ncbi:hypothetical protein ACQCSX_08975 [Pseudarthrobacter sp. P1]|uniref:hypothetical protein n=1 Tax=Pseudarthrobacter sp. P1 TaxID=3418418 RepID=UPI003CF959AA